MSGRNAPRSKNGCSTCRRRKVKCGEERPTCSRCSNLRLSCEWGVPVQRDRGVQVRHLQPAPSATDQLIWSAPQAGDVVDIPDALLASLSPISWPDDAVLLEPPQLVPFYPPVAPTQIPTPLYPPLSADIACANSLTLTEHDQKYFQYFPSSSIVYYYMKGWQWSSFCYLYQGPAATNKVIMRMILALSACDMHRHGLVRPPRRHVSVEELEIIFATMFLMVTYEWQFGHSVRHLQLHLHGVRSLLESHPQLFRFKDVNDVFLSAESTNDNSPTDERSISKVSFIPEQFLLWILYIDGSCRPMGLTESLNDYVMQSKNPALKPDHLHRCARLWGRCFWGEQYPDQEVLDDIENYRALELLHSGFTMRYRTWKVLVDSGAGTESGETLFRDIMATREYSDLFITAKFAGTVSARRTLHTIYMAVCTFYAQIILHRRLLCVDSLPSAIHRQATAGIVDIARKQFASDPRLLRRLHWPLLMAIIETDDPSHQAWCRQRLFEFRDFHSEYIWANELADQIVVQQDVSQGVYVNLAELLLQRLQV
ncbi:hypothetical protein N7448_008926 [Penicillium atrosanguineum]|nr:hypothetical protein N7448_008926 [Penicillium atrosanguineum]